MIVHRQVALAMLAVLFLAAAVFCYAGYAMVASFAAAGGSGDPGATRYLVGLVVAGTGALAAGLAAWRADRPSAD